MKVSIRTCRLGDIIRLIQTSVQDYSPLELCVKFKCKTCGRNVYDVASLVLSLMDCDKTHISLVAKKMV